MTKEEPTKKTLAGRLAVIGKEIGAVAKTGQNSGYRESYNFIEYGEVAGRIRELLDKHGVAIIPSVESYEKSTISSSRGSQGFHYILTMKFTAINADDQSDRIESMWVGESADYGDKGINKAITAGTKYFIMRLFNISEKGDDNDANSVEMTAMTTEEPKAVDKIPIDAIIAKIKTLATVEEVDKARESIFERYPLMLDLERRRVDAALNAQRGAVGRGE